jgi:dermatan 4-sulfotransferase 1
MLNKIRHIKRFKKIRHEKPDYWCLPEDNLGYIQIPKVASRSIRIALISHICNENASNFGKEKLSQYTKAYSSHIAQKNIRKTLPKAFIFSFVRHPYERIWSCYKNKVATPNTPKNIFACHNISQQDSFNTFVNKICEIPDTEADRHFRSQSWFLMDGETLIPDFVGKLEDMQTGWESLRDRFSLPEISHRNATAKGCEISTRNKTLIQQRYQYDFVNFYPEQY